MEGEEREPGQEPGEARAMKEREEKGDLTNNPCEIECIRGSDENRLASLQLCLSDFAGGFLICFVSQLNSTVHNKYDILLIFS